MDEIAQLQAEFMQLQMQQASHKLSERVCVEILLKLIQREKVKVFYTNDRKEFLTPKQLTREIYDEILSSGGRMDISDLFPILNLDESVLESVAKELVESERSLSLLGQTILADYYLDRVAEEINESLIESGQLHLSAVAQRFALPLDFITSLIQVRLMSAAPSKYRRFIEGSLEPPLLYTKAFIGRHSAILRGILSGITVPTPLHKIVQHFEFDETVFYAMFNELTNSKRIPGCLQGRGEGTDFVPDIFTKHRNSSIEQFFKQNGYIEHNTLSHQYQVAQPQKYLKTNFAGDGMFLPSCFLANTEIALLEDAIEESIEQGEWINAQPLLPSPLTDEDVSAVLRDSKIFRNQKKAVAHHFSMLYVVSNKFMNDLLNKFELRYKEWAEEDSGSRKELLASVDDLRSSTGSNPSILDEEEDFDDVRKSGKGKKNKRRAKGKKKKGGNTQSSNTANVQALADSYTAQNKIYLTEWFPTLPMCLVDDIIFELHSKLVELREAAARAIFLDSSTKKKFDGHDWQTELQQLYSNILLFHNAILSYTGDAIPLEKHLLRSLATDMAHLLVEAVATQNFVKLDHSPLENVKQRNIALKKLKTFKPIHEQLSNMCSALSKTCEEWLESLFPIFDALGLSMKMLDKKSEKLLVSAHLDSLTGQFQAEQNPANAFHLGVMLLYVKKKGRVLHVPGKMIVDVLQELNSTFEQSSEFVELIRFGDKVKEYLTAKIKKTGEAEDLFNNLALSLPTFTDIVNKQ